MREAGTRTLRSAFPHNTAPIKIGAAFVLRFGFSGPRRTNQNATPCGSESRTRSRGSAFPIRPPPLAALCKILHSHKCSDPSAQSGSEAVRAPSAQVPRTGPPGSRPATVSNPAGRRARGLEANGNHRAWCPGDQDSREERRLSRHLRRQIRSGNLRAALLSEEDPENRVNRSSRR